MRKVIAVSLVIAALITAGVASAFSLSREAGESGMRHLAGCITNQLTEEQREALSQKIKELEDKGATREEIREAVHQFLKDLGITIDESCCEMKGIGHRGPAGGCITNQLTEEQREALSQKIKELEDAGATREEIREAVHQFLKDLGITMEGCRGMKPERGRHGK